MRRLVEADPLGKRPRRDRAEILLGQKTHLFRIDIAGNDEDRVVRRVPLAIERQRVLGAEPLDLGFPADRRDAVGVVQKQRRNQLFVQQRGGLVIDPHAPLFEHDIALRTHPRIVEDEAGHAVRFEPHQHFQPVAGDGLVIAGIVRRGECIVPPAGLRDKLRELARRDCFRPLEHQMFEKMGDARLSARIVGGADPIPDGLRHRRDPMVRQHDNLHAVGEGEALDLEFLRRGRHYPHRHCPIASARSNINPGKPRYEVAEKRRARGIGGGILKSRLARLPLNRRP